jgi:threonine/homoserine/homoserine lactone efflux protein
MAENIVVLLLAAIPLMGSPGPATLSLAAAGSVYGVAPSLWYLAGIIGGTAVVLLLIASGITGLLFAVPGVLPVLTAAALLYILYLAYKIARAPVLSQGADQGEAPSLAGGLLLAVGNPKAFAAIGAVYAGVAVVPALPLWDAVVKVAALSAVIVVVNTSWLAAGAALSRFLRHPRIGRGVNVIFALLLVVSVALAFLP